MPESTFGEELRRLRLAAGFGTGSISLLLRIDPPQLRRIEKGKQIPSRATVDRLLSVLALPETQKQSLRELAFLARGECCPRCGFGGGEPLGTSANARETG